MYQCSAFNSLTPRPNTLCLAIFIALGAYTASANSNELIAPTIYVVNTEPLFYDGTGSISTLAMIPGEIAGSFVASAGNLSLTSPISNNYTISGGLYPSETVVRLN